MNFQITKLPGHEALPLPSRGTPDAVGLDIHSAMDTTIAPGQRQLIPTGIAIALPPGFEGQIRPRSGLALKHGITVLNSPGTIDPDYRGELKVLLINHGQEDFAIHYGDRIAQLVICKVEMASFVQVDKLDNNTTRGDKGYGSTGI